MCRAASGLQAYSFDAGERKKGGIVFFLDSSLFLDLVCLVFLVFVLNTTFWRNISMMVFSLSKSKLELKVLWEMSEYNVHSCSFMLFFLGVSNHLSIHHFF